jgi:hypothetical protein
MLLLKPAHLLCDSPSAQKFHRCGRPTAGARQRKKKDARSKTFGNRVNLIVAGQAISASGCSFSEALEMCNAAPLEMEK